MIPYFSTHCISDHRISNSKPNPNSNPNPNPNPNPDHDYSHVLVRDAVVRNAVGRKGGHLIYCFILLYIYSYIICLFIHLNSLITKKTETYSTKAREALVEYYSF